MNQLDSFQENDRISSKDIVREKKGREAATVDKLCDFLWQKSAEELLSEPESWVAGEHFSALKIADWTIAELYNSLSKMKNEMNDL